MMHDFAWLWSYAGSSCKKFGPVFWDQNMGFGTSVELHFVSNVYKLHQIILIYGFARFGSDSDNFCTKITLGVIFWPNIWIYYLSLIFLAIYTKCAKSSSLLRKPNADSSCQKHNKDHTILILAHFMHYLSSM